MGKSQGEERKKHEHLLLVKGLHEVAHLMTPIFMKQIGYTANPKSSKSKFKYDTPTKVGTIRVRKVKFGEAGYGLEDLLSGGRMFHERTHDEFTIETLTLHRRKRKRFEIAESFTSNKKTDIDEFIVPEDHLKSVRDTTSLKKTKKAIIFVPHHIQNDRDYLAKHGRKA